jgi:hypothetical protein
MFFCFRSTLKKSGRFSLSAVPGRHSPSLKHSATAVGTQTKGTDPSYLLAASAFDGARPRLPAASRMSIALRSFINPRLDTRICDIASSPHCVSSSGHASSKCLIKVATPLVQHVLLLLQVGTLLKLLLFVPAPAPHCSEEPTHCSAYGRAFSRVSSNRATDRSHCGSPAPPRSRLPCGGPDCGDGPPGIWGLARLKPVCWNAQV